MSEDFSLSTLSLYSADSNNEDWDRSLMVLETEGSSSQTARQPPSITTSRNSVVFPADDCATPGRSKSEALGSPDARGKRSLSELMKLHAEKGTDCIFSPQEASRVADVLGQWINASSSPYEGEDDFFARSLDDLSIPAKKSSNTAFGSRPRGRSESANSRPPSSTGFVKVPN